MKDKLIIFGDGAAAEVVAKIVEEFQIYKIATFAVNRKFKKKKKVFNYDVIEYEKLKKIKKKENYKFFVAMGYSNLNKDREKIYKQIKKDGFKIVNIIHPRCNISKSVTLGENCFIMQDVHIHPLVKIGNNNFLWSGTILCHHTFIGNNCWFTSGSSIAGNTRIGNNCFFGINSTVTNNINIGSNCFIGAQTLVSSDLKAKSVVIKKGDKLFKLKSEEFTKLISNSF